MEVTEKWFRLESRVNKMFLGVRWGRRVREKFRIIFEVWVGVLRRKEL